MPDTKVTLGTALVTLFSLVETEKQQILHSLKDRFISHPDLDTLHDFEIVFDTVLNKLFDRSLDIFS
jgi:hypothetical protein